MVWNRGPEDLLSHDGRMRGQDVVLGTLLRDRDEVPDIDAVMLQQVPSRVANILPVLWCLVCCPVRGVCGMKKLRHSSIYNLTMLRKAPAGSNFL